VSSGVLVASTLGVVVLAGTLFVLGPATRTGSQFVPRFEYHSSRGCFDIDVYAVNEAQTEVLAVQVDFSSIGPSLDNRPFVWDLATSSPAVRVYVEVYETNRHNWRCTDVGLAEPGAPTIWVARAGVLTVVRGARATPDHEYPVTIRIADAEFSSPVGATIRPPQPVTIQTMAGQLIGG
jgi:hypothetical protein